MGENGKIKETNRKIIAHMTDQEKTKTCPYCGEDKPLRKFRGDKRYPDGRAKICNNCHYEKYVKKKRISTRVYAFKPENETDRIALNAFIWPD